MAKISRYEFSKKISSKYYGTSNVNTIIYNAVENNEIGFKTIFLSEYQRLDQIAGSYYKDSTYWWVIAAASGIGWAMQLPPGTIIRVPNNLEEVLSILG